MKRQLNLIIILLAITLFSNLSFSQMSIGGQLQYTRYINFGYEYKGVGFTGVSINGDRTKRRWVYRASLNYDFPAKIDREFNLYDSQGSGSSNTFHSIISGREKYTSARLWVDVNFFFTGDGEDGGFFGFSGMGLSVLSASHEIDSYNQSLYFAPDYESGREWFFQPILRFGLGYDVNFNFGNVFMQLYGNLPANVVNGNDVDIELPFSFGSSVGVRIPI